MCYTVVQPIKKFYISRKKLDFSRYQIIVSGLAILLSLILMIWVNNNRVELPNIYLIFAFCLLLLIIILDKLFPQMFTRTTIYFLIVVLLVAFITIVGNNELEKSYNIEKSLDQDYGDYRFSLEHKPFNDASKISIYAFKVSYDFLTNKGNISFHITNQSLISLQYLMFRHPREINVSKVIIQGFTYENQTQNESIELDSFNILNQSYDGSVLIEVVSSDKFKPNAKFVVESNFYRISNDFLEPTMELNLGHYGCLTPCFEGNIFFSPIIKREGKTIRTFIPTDYYSNFSSRQFKQEFNLNTINEKSAQEAQDSKNFGIGLVISGIVLYFEAFAQLVVSMIKPSKKDD